MLNFAHVKWFIEGDTVAEPSLNASEWFVVILILVAGLVVLSIISDWLKSTGTTKKIDKSLSKFKQLVPLVVRISTAALLYVNAAQNYLLAPNVAQNDSTISALITFIFLTSGTLILFGLFTRQAAALILVGYLLVLTQTDAINVLDHFEYIGIVGYLWFRGPGIYSIDARLKNNKLPLPKNRKLSLPIYRISVGAALAILALSEKLLNTSAAQNFLYHYDWNILATVGVSDRWFIVIAGSIELLVGIGLILNKAPRLLTLVVLCLMITTAILLGVEEIYGHLFAAGIVFAVWVNDFKPVATDKP